MSVWIGAHLESSHVYICLGCGICKGIHEQGQTNVLAGIARAYVGDLGLGETSPSAHTDCSSPSHAGISSLSFHCS